MIKIDKQFANLIAAENEPEEEVVDKGGLCCRVIFILYDDDPDDLRKEMVRARLDTGSGHTFIFESELRKLELRYDASKGTKEFLSITNDRFKAVGTRQLFFKYKGIGTVHSVTAYVLKDPLGNQKPGFDILLGRDHLIQSRALIANPEVIGTNMFCSLPQALSFQGLSAFLGL